jgi:Uma2 family endonuclease
MVMDRFDLAQPTTDEIVYPDSDGQPMAENTKQYDWITTIKGNLDIIYAADPQVFIAGDLFWYPVEGHPEIRQAPDVLVVFGRPKGHRGSYQQWREANIAPQVVFEILSPGNTVVEMNRKFRFYERYGVEEYYLYDPDTGDLQGWRRLVNHLVSIPDLQNWVSPRLGIRFVLAPEGLLLYQPDGTPFLTFVELALHAEQAEERATQAEDRASRAEDRAAQAEDRASRAEDRATQAEDRAARLAARLRELGIEPENNGA